MQLQDTPETWLFKLWPWIETNKIRLAWAAAILALAIGLISYLSWQRSQRQILAGQALTQLMMTDSRSMPMTQQADLYLKLARDYQNTMAGQRALIGSASMLYEAGRYTDAQARFQNFLDQYPASFFAAQAALGVASCLDAQGKAQPAADAYQQVINNYSDAVAVNYAKFSLAGIDERLGKRKEALSLYQEVARANPNTQLGADAGLQAMQINTKPASAAPAAPFKLNSQP